MSSAVLCSSKFILSMAEFCNAITCLSVRIRFIYAILVWLYQVLFHRRNKSHDRQSSTKRIAKSLGVNPDTSLLSWSTSLQTPPRYTDLQGIVFKITESSKPYESVWICNVYWVLCQLRGLHVIWFGIHPVNVQICACMYSWEREDESCSTPKISDSQAYTGTHFGALGLSNLIDLSPIIFFSLNLLGWGGEGVLAILR